MIGIDKNNKKIWIVNNNSNNNNNKSFKKKGRRNGFIWQNNWSASNPSFINFSSKSEQWPYNKPIQFLSKGFTKKNFKFLNKNILFSLDLTKISDKSLFLVRSLIILCLRKNSNYNIIYLTIRHAWEKLRKTFIKKCLKNLKNGMPKISQETGNQIAETVYKMLLE